MILSRNSLNTPALANLNMPNRQVFDLPEKVLQFGTGVLLRGLPDYYISKANQQGLFNGRIAVVKSIPGPTDEFDVQDNLYTLYIKGIKNGKAVDDSMICSAISRVIPAGQNWNSVLEVARSRDLQIVISNTTEIGIQLLKESITNNPPESFPGKLLAVLYERYKAFNGESNAGLVILPTELITNNGDLLKSIVTELALFNQLDAGFMEWLVTANSFCNTLADRIVPGRPDAHLTGELQARQGYTDGLSVVTEPYNLWAIEGDEQVAAILSFSQADEGMVITPNIEKFKELKLRLLNAPHTLTCAIAYLCGFKTVVQAMENAAFFGFIERLLFDEIIPAMLYPIDKAEADQFAHNVLDRFLNPHIQHPWINISMQYSEKLKSRVLPLLVNYYKKYNKTPHGMAIGFAAFIRFMQIEQGTDGKYTGSFNDDIYTVTDKNAVIFEEATKITDKHKSVDMILSDQQLWGTDLTLLRGFKDEVIDLLEKITPKTVLQLLEATKTAR